MSEDYINKKEIKEKIGKELTRETNNKKKLLEREELMNKNLVKGSKRWLKLKLKSEYEELDNESKQRLLIKYNLMFLEELWKLIVKKELTSNHIINDKFTYKSFDNFYKGFQFNLQLTI